MINKETIANLADEKMANVKGGAETSEGSSYCWIQPTPDDTIYC